jgi:transcriptional regulator GlxA family with amidase domain
LTELAAAGAAVLVAHMQEDSWPGVREALTAFLVRNEPRNGARADDVKGQLQQARADLINALDRGELEVAADVEAEWRMRLRRVLRDEPRATGQLDSLLRRFTLHDPWPSPPAGPGITTTGRSATPPAAAVEAVARHLAGRRRPEVVGVLLFSGGAALETSIPLSVFGIDRQDAGVPRYRLLVCAGEEGPLRTTGGLEVTAPHGLDATSRAGTVVVPSWRSISQPPPEEALDALRRAHAEGARIVGLSTGVFVLAAAGLLDGRRATTHWMYAPTLAKRYPVVRLDPREPFVDDGSVLTSAGTGGSIDLCLHIVRRDHGPDAADALARRLVISPRRSRSDERRLDRALPEEIGADPLGEAMAWALEHLHEPFDVETLASRAYLSRREFGRRFRSLTGSAPLEWLTTQRLLQAQRLLETSDYSIDDIATRCGFRSPDALRGHFRRVLGSSPAAYRAAYRARAAQTDPADPSAPPSRAGSAGSRPRAMHTSPGPSTAPDDDEWPEPPAPTEPTPAAPHPATPHSGDRSANT